MFSSGGQNSVNFFNHAFSNSLGQPGTAVTKSMATKVTLDKPASNIDMSLFFITLL